MCELRVSIKVVRQPAEHHGFESKAMRQQTGLMPQHSVHCAIALANFSMKKPVCKRHWQGGEA